LSTTITRFRNWQEIGFKIHVYSDGSYEGEFVSTKTER